jgi:hypothetical protein
MASISSDGRSVVFFTPAKISAIGTARRPAAETTCTTAS